MTYKKAGGTFWVHITASLRDQETVHRVCRRLVRGSIHLPVCCSMPAGILMQQLLGPAASHARSTTLLSSGLPPRQPVRGPRRCSQTACPVAMSTAHMHCRWAVGGPPCLCVRLPCSLPRRSIPDETRWRARRAHRRYWSAAGCRWALLMIACMAACKCQDIASALLAPIVGSAGGWSQCAQKVASLFSRVAQHGAAGCKSPGP